jgi:hypothetical protein
MPFGYRFSMAHLVQPFTTELFLVCVVGLTAAPKPLTLAHTQVHSIVALRKLLEPEETSSHPHVCAY